MQLDPELVVNTLSMVIFCEENRNDRYVAGVAAYVLARLLRKAHDMPTKERETLLEQLEILLRAGGAGDLRARADAVAGGPL